MIISDIPEGGPPIGVQEVNVPYAFNKMNKLTPIIGMRVPTTIAHQDGIRFIGLEFIFIAFPEFSFNQAGLKLGLGIQPQAGRNIKPTSYTLVDRPSS